LTPSSFLPLKIQGKDAFGATLEGRIGFLKAKDKGYLKSVTTIKTIIFQMRLPCNESEPRGLINERGVYPII
jgi:hypothetical protein